ncbi:Uncharacterised protein [Mycobacteroides abscessus subsp. abscessus]|nr:Uncharacterised protein [Mycobacteroides abscessus subsp. abscessus]
MASVVLGLITRMRMADRVRRPRVIGAMGSHRPVPMKRSC